MRKYEDAWDQEDEGTTTLRAILNIVAVIVIGALLAFGATLLL